MAAGAVEDEAIHTAQRGGSCHGRDNEHGVAWPGNNGTGMAIGVRHGKVFSWHLVMAWWWLWLAW